MYSTTAGSGNTAHQIDKLTNLAKNLELDKSSSSKGSKTNEEEGAEKRDSTDCTLDEETNEKIVENRPTNSIQLPRESDAQCAAECDAIEHISKLLGEMTVILDESICSSNDNDAQNLTPPKHRGYRDGESNNDARAIPLTSVATSYDLKRSRVPVNLSLLRQMANINSDIRDVSIDGIDDGEGQCALVGGDILIKTIEKLLAERSVMVREVVLLLEAAREETSALRDLPRYSNAGEKLCFCSSTLTSSTAS